MTMTMEGVALAKTGITHLSAGVPISASASLVRHTVQALHSLRGFELVIFPRSEGVPPPFVLLDGHSSRFQPQFLKYITDPRHIWEVCLGLPNGTHVWQVGDSKQQNGSFKRLLILAKRSLIQEKQDNQEQSKIGKVDIIPLVSKAFSGSFSNVQGNTHAISERGWNPLNQNCLKDPKVLATKVAKKVATTGTEEQASTETSTSDIVRKP
jgi:hypothetical protein